MGGVPAKLPAAIHRNSGVLSGAPQVPAPLSIKVPSPAAVGSLPAPLIKSNSMTSIVLFFLSFFVFLFTPPVSRRQARRLLARSASRSTAGSSQTRLRTRSSRPRGSGSVSAATLPSRTSGPKRDSPWTSLHSSLSRGFSVHTLPPSLSCPRMVSQHLDNKCIYLIFFFFFDIFLLQNMRACQMQSSRHSRCQRRRTSSRPWPSPSPRPSPPTCA